MISNQLTLHPDPLEGLIAGESAYLKSTLSYICFKIISLKVRLKYLNLRVL